MPPLTCPMSTRGGLDSGGGGDGGGGGGGGGGGEVAQLQYPWAIL